MENPSQIFNVEQELKDIYDHPRRVKIVNTVSGYLKHNPFKNKSPRLTAYQIAKIAMNLSKILNTPEQALNFIQHYLRHETADDLFSACNFQLPVHSVCPDLWRYLAGDKDYLRDGGFRRLLCMIDKIEPDLIDKGFIVKGNMQPNKCHLIMMDKKKAADPKEKVTKENGKAAPPPNNGGDFGLLVHGLSIYSGLSVKELEDELVVQERARLFFMHDVREEHFTWFQETLKTTKLDQIPQHVPQLTLQGKDFNLPPNWYLQCMLPTDPRFGVLGKLTDCCLHPGKSEGKKILEVLLTDPRTGVYVVCKKTKNTPSDKDPIMIATYVLRANPKTLIFCASFGARHNEGSRQKIQQAYRFLTQFAQYLVEHQGIEKVYRGPKAWDIPHWYFGIPTQVMKPAQVLPQDILAVGAEDLSNKSHPFLAFDIGDYDYQPRPLILVADANLDPRLVAVRKPGIETLDQWKKELGERSQVLTDKPAILSAEAFKAGKNSLGLALFNEIIANTSLDTRLETRRSLVRTLMPHLVYCCTEEELKSFLEDIEVRTTYSKRGYELEDIRPHYSAESISYLQSLSDELRAGVFPRENLLLLVAGYIPEKMDFFMERLGALEPASRLELLNSTLNLNIDMLPPENVYRLMQARNMLQDTSSEIFSNTERDCLREYLLEKTVEADDAVHFEKFAQQFGLTSQALVKKCLYTMEGFQCLRFALKSSLETELVSPSQDFDYIASNPEIFNFTLEGSPLNWGISMIETEANIRKNFNILQKEPFVELCFAEMLQVLSDETFKHFRLPVGLSERAQDYLQGIIGLVAQVRTESRSCMRIEPPVTASTTATAPEATKLRILGFSSGMLAFLQKGPGGAYAKWVRDHLRPARCRF